MAVRALIPAERLNIAHVNSVDGSTDYEPGVAYKAGCVVTYNGNTYVANIDIEDTDTDTPDAAPDKWGLCPNAKSLVEGGEVADLENRVAALEGDVEDIITDLTAAGYGLVKTDKVSASADGVKTYQQVMDELANGILALVGTLDNDERIMITSAQLGGIGRLNTISDVYTNAISSLSIQGISQSLTVNETHLNSAYMVTTANNSHLNRTVINSGGAAFSNKDSDVPASGSTNEVRYALFKKLVTSS